MNVPDSIRELLLCADTLRHELRYLERQRDAARLALARLKGDVVKAQWATAPSWAQYLAKDASGEWHWFSYLPLKDRFTSTWVPANRVETQYSAAAVIDVFNLDWGMSLSERPK